MCVVMSVVMQFIMVSVELHVLMCFFVCVCLFVCVSCLFT